MKRQIDAILDNWLANNKSAILLFGARQVGKTYSIRECFKRNNRRFVEINFATNKTALDLFSKLTSIDDFYVKLSLLSSSSLIDGESCVFLDEIQEIYRYREDLKKSEPSLYHQSIDLITLMKALVEENRFTYALSGSLLGLNLSEIQSNPVGYLDSYTMYPLSFEEFLMAKGIEGEIIDYLKRQFEDVKEVDSAIHDKMMGIYREYFLVGGMPQAVSSYLEHSDLSKVRTIQKQILLGYGQDIQKYAPSEKRILIGESFKNIPSELNRKDKHFRKSKLNYPNAKNLDLSDTFLWLTNAGVALATYNVNEPVYPLKLNEDRKTLKLFANDIGLLSYQLFDKEGSIKVLTGDCSTNFGAPFENAVAEELAYKGFGLNYWNSKKIGEVDFLIQHRGEVIPFEVKSGDPNRNGNFSHPALDNLLEVYPTIEKAYIVSKMNLFQENEKVINIPIYMLMFLPRAV